LAFNEGKSSLVIVCPLTTKERRIRTHIRIEPPEGGLRETSFIMVEAVRSISKQRLVEHWGVLSMEKLKPVEDVLRILFAL
jgi:mRNA interferase MazF